MYSIQGIHLFCYHDSKKAMLAKDVALIHGRSLREINEVITRNIKRFKDEIDIIDLLNRSERFRGQSKIGF